VTTVTLTTPGLNNWTVPAGVSEILVELFGGQGGDGANGGSAGGEGGTVAVEIATIPGEQFLFAIAGAAGTAPATGTSSAASNGGYGFGGRGYGGGGGGGCFTSAMTGSGGALYALAAGGGGGAPSITSRTGGAGGPNTGQQGLPLGGPFPTVIPAGGDGGSQIGGGQTGLGDNLGYGSVPGSAWQGGDGDYSPNGTANRGAPGGGSGYRGGGGGGRGYVAGALTAHATAGGGGSNFIATGGAFWSAPVAVTNAAGGNTGAGWVRITYGPADHCSLFEATIADVVASDGVTLSVASNSFPDALSNYRISFFDDTTSGTTPSGGLLNAGPWSIGPMAAGQHISYAIRRIDGGHIDGSCVMRATDTTFGLTWDVTVQCPANPWGYNLSFGQRSGL